MATHHDHANLIWQIADQFLNKAAGQRFHNHSPLDFQKLKGDPDNIDKHLVMGRITTNALLPLPHRTCS